MSSLNVFPFTNENLQSYKELYEFNNARVLSVVGSGDQYFTSILNGAKEVDLFDINDLAWKYFVLKFYAIQKLSYKDFWKYFIFRSHVLKKNKQLSKKISTQLPEDILNFWIKEFDEDEESLCSHYAVRSYIQKKIFVNHNYKNGQFIPYMDENVYYKLQELLCSRKLPNFFLTNFIGIDRVCGNTAYDLIIASNILSWQLSDCLSMKEEINRLEEYLKTVNNLKFSEMQANYIWRVEPLYLEDHLSIYLDNGFVPTLVQSVDGRDKKDCVLSLKRGR